MDYGKSGNAKSGKGTPRFAAQPRKGGPVQPESVADARAQMLERMKAAAAARKAETKPKG